MSRGLETLNLDRLPSHLFSNSLTGGMGRVATNGSPILSPQNERSHIAIVEPSIGSDATFAFPSYNHMLSWLQSHVSHRCNKHPGLCRRQGAMDSLHHLILLICCTNQIMYSSMYMCIVHVLLYVYVQHCTMYCILICSTYSSTVDSTSQNTRYCIAPNFRRLKFSSICQEKGVNHINCLIFFVY